MKPIRDLTGVTALHDFLCFEVQSFSDPGKTYRVDKSSWNGSGSCSCERFCCVIQPELGKGNWTGYKDGKYIGTQCKHITKVDKWYSCMSARRAIEERQKLMGKPYNASEPNL